MSEFKLLWNKRPWHKEEATDRSLSLTQAILTAVQWVYDHRKWK